ncbi:hypothetical protein ACFRQM_09525 [Streptomyces sp. NPDC056831]|uniref:hypothetical protein n=1 Tax=Streptomyces sp. NPDC056831 TaxID=3345954 RepID=UPI0036798061
MDQFTTAPEIRTFLALCLNPGHGIKRTPAKLAEAMPVALRDRMETHAPQLAHLRVEAERLEAAADQARQAHATALEQWIKTTAIPTSADPAAAVDQDQEAPA